LSVVGAALAAMAAAMLQELVYLVLPNSIGEYTAMRQAKRREAELLNQAFPNRVWEREMQHSLLLDRA